jgi:hypothetical protein
VVWNDNIPEEDRFYNITSYGVQSPSFSFLALERNENDILLDMFFSKAIIDDSTCEM